MKARLGWAVLVLLCLVVSGWAGDVDLNVVSKFLLWSQSGPDDPNGGSAQFAGFSVRVDPSAPEAVASASIAVPGHGSTVLVSDGAQWGFEQMLLNRKELNAAYPDGSYVTTIGTAHDGTKVIALTLAGDKYPVKAPRIANWTAAQAVNADADFTLQWDAPRGEAEGLLVTVNCLDADGNLVFLSSLGTLDGSKTEVTIPAGTFHAGEKYNCLVNFIRLVDANETAYPGVVAIAGYMKGTEFSIMAAPTVALAAPLAATVSNACTDQCKLTYSSCLYSAMAARNACMLRCSMGINPSKCGPACMKYYRQLTQNCDAALKQCVNACPVAAPPAATGLNALAVTAAAATTTNVCTYQCDLTYSTCLYSATAGRNACMLRCSMTLYPKKCYPACRSYYSQATRDCEAAHKNCLTACP